MIKVNEEALKKAGQQFQAAKATVQSSGQAATPGAVLEEMHYQQSGEHSFNPNSAASYEAGIWDGYEGKERDDLYAGLDFAYNNAGSTLYNPYRQATNTEYTDTLKKYGLDVPDVITSDWIDQQWSIYGGSLRKKDDGSLGKARNRNEQIARALYGLEGIEYTTQKAENELEDIRQTVNWYATHGYSQDYITKVVGGMKHSTLDSIAITRDPKAIESTDDDGYTISTKRGTTVGLNRSAYFDDDILTGMYWKAINGVDDVSDFDAAVYAYQNKGKLRGGSKRLEDMRTYGNPNYNPHNDGCTNIEAKMAFGQDEFTYDDILRLRAETDENDTKRMNLIKDLFDNETRTANAEKELASIKTDMASLDYTLNIPSGYKSPKEYFTELADNWLSGDTYKTLATMDKRREEGNPMDINRSVNYRKEDIVAEMVARYNAAHGITNNPKEALAPAKPMSQEDALRIASGEITPDQIETKTPDIPEPPVKPAEEGNIDIDNRQVVKNEDGTFSTEESFSTNIDGLEVLLPTIIDGKRVSEDEAIAHYLETGENLGKFKTVEDAEAYAEWLHNRQEKVYGEKAEPEQQSEQSKERYNIEVGGHYVQVPVYDKDGNRMTEEEAMQAYINSQNGSSSGGYTAPALPDTPTNYERRDDEEMRNWVDTHTTDSFDPNFVMLKPSEKNGWDGTVAAGGAVSDQPTRYKHPEPVYTVTDKEGAQEFTSTDLLRIMNAAYSGDGDQLTEEERRMGEGLINSIPWAFGDSLQWLGTNGEFDSGAMRRMDKTAQALGEDLRNVRGAASGYYATSGEKADIAVRFFEDALAASNAGMEIAEWYANTEEGQRRKQELLDEAAGINQRADDIKAENDEKAAQAKREALAANLAIMQAPPVLLDENGRAAVDQMTLRPGEADSILAMPEAKDTWDKEGRAFVDYVDANFATPYQEALNNDDLTAAQDIVCRFMGFPKGTNVDGISEDMFNAEQLGIIEVAKQLYAQDAKIAMASGMTLEEYYETVGHRNAEDLMHASFEYRQLMNGEDSISEEAKQGIGVLATVWNGMKLGAVDVASSDVGFVADIANILTSPGDFESLSTRYTNRYGFFQGRSQYRNDVDTMLAWWESQDDEASQQKAAEYREKMKLIDANGLDIFNLGFNPDTDLLERVRKQVNDEINATQDWIDQYATDAEKHGVQIIRSATGSGIQQTRALALSAVTGLPTGLTTTMSFLPGSFESHMEEARAHNWDDTRSYMYAMIGGIMDAAMEGEMASNFYNFGGNAMAGWLDKSATKFAATHGITGLGAHLVYGLMVYGANSAGEISQELLQNVAGGIYDYLWSGSTDAIRESLSKDTIVDTILSTALSTFMSTTAHQATAEAKGAPSVFSNKYKITAAAMMEYSPEFRQNAGELLRVLNAGDDVNMFEGVSEAAAAAEEASAPETAPAQTPELTQAPTLTHDEVLDTQQGPESSAVIPESDQEMAGSAQMADNLLDNLLNNPDLNLEAVTVDDKGRTAPATIKEELNAFAQRRADIQAQLQDAEQTRAQAQQLADQAAESSPEMAEAHRQGVAQQEQRIADLQAQQAELDQEEEAARRKARADIMAGKLRIQETWNAPEGFTQVPDPGLDWSDDRFTPQPGVNYGPQQEEMPELADEPEAAPAAPSVPQTVDGIPQGQVTMEEAIAAAPETSTLPAGVTDFINKSTNWFKQAYAQLQGIQAKMAETTDPAVQESLARTLETVRERINAAKAEVLDRMTKMDIKLKMAAFVNNPEALADFVSYTASSHTSSKIAAGALTAKPSTKGKLRAKLEAAEAADAANKAAADARATAQQAGAAVTAARNDNRENPTPENAQKEIDAVKKKVDADKKADEAQKAADTANVTAQKTEEDLNKDLQSNLEALRQDTKEDAQNTGEELKETVNASLDSELEAIAGQTDLGPVAPAEDVVTIAEQDATAAEPTQEEAQEVAESTKAQDMEETDAAAEQAALPDTSDILERVKALNIDGKKRILSNYHLLPAIAKAAQNDESIRNLLRGMDDIMLQALMKDMKRSGIKTADVVPFLKDAVRYEAEQSDQSNQTTEKDSLQEAKEKLTSLKDAVMSMKANSSAPELNEPAKAVQTVLADQLRRLYAEKDKLEAARAEGKSTAEILKNIRKIRREMAGTMDFAGQVLRRYENSQGYSKAEPDKFTAKNNLIRDWLKKAAQEDKNGNTKAASNRLKLVSNREDSFDAEANYIMRDINELVSAGNRVTGKNAVQAYIAGPSRRGANVPGTQGIWQAGQRPTGIAKDGGTAENQPLRSTYQIGQKLASDLGIGLYDPTRRFYAGPEATGAYYPGNEHIEIRGHHANDERVIYHEIGHHIQNVTHMDTTQSMLDNADPVFLRQYAPTEQPGEAFAEFVRTYVNNREKACAIYGEDEVENFEREMRVAGIFGPIQEAALNQMRLNTATYREIGESHMKDVNNRSRPQSATREVSDAARKFIIGMVDDTEAAARFDRRAGRQNNEHMLTLQDHLKLMKPAQKQATGLITDALVDMSGRRISEGFADTIAGTDENGNVYKMTEQDLKDLANLSLYMHAVDRMDRAEGDALADKLNRAIETATQNKIQAEISAEIARRTAGMSRAQAEHFTLTPQEIADITRYAELTPQELAEIRDRTRLTPEEARRARLTTQVYNEEGDTGLTRERLLSNIAEITERNPWAVDAHERMIGWWMDFTQVWGVNTGLITQKQYNDMWEKWPNYVPTYREGKGNELDFDSHTFDGSDGGFKLQRIVGSDRDVMNPLLGFSRNIGYYVEGARRNAALNHIYWEMQHNEEGFGDFCREVRQPGEHTLSFRDPDGTQRYLEFQDRELFEVIADNCRPAQAGQVASTIGKLTRSMAMFTTGSNPLFAMKNFVRDFQQGVNHGTWAYTYADGAVKWLRAAWEMHRNTNNAQSYKALAGEDGGRLSIPDNQKDADQLLRMFSEEYGRTGAVGRAKRVASRAWDIVTAKNFNEFIEQTTRYAEYRFGQHELRTSVGRQKAYLAAQESTTNFALSGNSQTASVLRKVIPFFNAALQGTYSVVHAASPAERSKLVQRFTKTAVNNLLTGAFAYGVLQLFGSDEDKEWYEKLANGVKADYIILPLGGDKAREFLRIPLTQNPIGKLFYAAGQDIMSSTTADRLTLDIQATVSGILSDLIQTDVVFSPFLNAANNETYYGSAIVPNWMEKRSPTEHYNENTADIFIKMARFFEALPLTRGNETLTDPMKLQYITQQETGFIGKLLLPTLTGTRAANYRRDPVAWAQNMWNIMRNDWTSDAAYSNDINDAYHEADDVLNRVMSDLSGAGYTDLMARNSNPEFVQEAHNVAAYLTGSTGPFKRISEEINGLYDQQDAIYNNDKLSMDEKLTMARDIQKKIVNLEAEGVGIFKEYASTYLNQHYGLDYVLYGGAKGDKNRSSVYGFPILAKAENSGKYEGLNNIMSHYKEVKEQNKGKANSALNPCPSTTVDITDDYSVPMYAMEPDAAEEYQNVYLSTLERGMSEYNALWGSMDSKKKAAAISKVKREANKAAKAVVVQYYKVNGLIPDENKNTSGTLPDPRK